MATSGQNVIGSVIENHLFRVINTLGTCNLLTEV